MLFVCVPIFHLIVHLCLQITETKKMSDYKILNHLGDGGFASVFLIQHETFGKVAFKKLGASNLPDTDVIRLKKEAEIHLRIRHPNIVSMFEAQFTSPDIGLFLEYYYLLLLITFVTR